MWNVDIKMECYTLYSKLNFVCGNSKPNSSLYDKSTSIVGRNGSGGGFYVNGGNMSGINLYKRILKAFVLLLFVQKCNND